MPLGEPIGTLSGRKGYMISGSYEPVKAASYHDPPPPPPPPPPEKPPPPPPLPPQEPDEPLERGTAEKDCPMDDIEWSKSRTSTRVEKLSHRPAYQLGAVVQMP